MADRLAIMDRPGKAMPTSRRSPDPLKGGDVYKWATEQAALLRAGKFDQIDIENVADEIESVGKSEFRSLTSHIEIILTHLLKWDHQPQRRSRSWLLSIDEHRQRVCDDLADSPSLDGRVEDAVVRAYRLARRAAARQTRLPLATFPEECGYDWHAITDRALSLDEPESRA